MTPQQQAIAEEALAEALAGNRARAIAERLGIATQSVHQWKVVPPRRALIVSEISGVRLARLRPDVYPAEQEASNG